MFCFECGQAMEVDENGVSNHVDENGNIDHDQDADHVAFFVDEDAQLGEL